MTLMPDSSNNTSALNAEIPSAGRLLSDPPGEVLKRARQARKLDLETAADQLNLSAQVVEALEEDAYEKLPSPTFIRGYIRCYARLLKLSGDDLVRSYERVATAQEPELNDTVEAPEGKPQKIKKGWIVLGVLLAVALGIGFVVSSGDSEKPVESEINREADAGLELEVGVVVSDVIVESAPETVTDVEPDVESQIEPAIVTKLAPTIEPKTEPKPDSKIITRSEESVAAVSFVPAIAPVLVATPVTASVTTPVAVIPETVAEIEVNTPVETSTSVEEPSLNEPEAVRANVELSTLTMEFSGECWVEVWDATGKRIYANLRKAGQRLSLRGVAPIEVKLGDGSTVKLAFNGSPVLFASSKRTSVAHVTLGE